MVEMCNLSDLIVERGLAQGMAQGMAQGRAEGEKIKTIEIALNLISGGVLSDEQIAAATGLSVNEVKDLHPEKL